MQFEFNNFLVKTVKKIETLDETFQKMIIKNHKRTDEYRDVHKIREFTVFHSLEFRESRYHEYQKVMIDTFDLIEFMELLRGFSSKKLDTERTYPIHSSDGNEILTMKIKQKQGKKFLSIYFSNIQKTLFLDSITCVILASQFGKILQRCEAWQWQERAL